MSAAEQDYTVPETIAAHPAWHRMEEQRAYYARRANDYQTRYKRIKLCLIGLASGLPLLAFLPLGGPDGNLSKYLVSAVGVIIAMLEGVLLLNQYGPLWVKYRGTAESLKRERWMLLARAGEYRALDDADALRLLAERTEVLLEVEHREWTQAQKQALEQIAEHQKGFEQQRPTAGQPSAG